MGQAHPTADGGGDVGDRAAAPAPDLVAEQAPPPEHAEAAFARINTDERQLTLYNTPFFLDLLVRQIRPDGTLPASRAALFAGFIRAALQREITARSPLFVEEGRDALLDERDRAWRHRPPRGTDYRSGTRMATLRIRPRHL